MSQAFTKKKFVPGSLRGQRSPHTLLLRMAADQDRADRIRETWLERKAEDPKTYTWARIAAFVGRTERAAQEWQKTGGIDYDNAVKLAEYLNVDFDWLWRGPKEDEQTPDLSGAAREDQVNDGFDEFRQYVRDIRRDVAELKGLLEAAQSEREAIRDLLKTQESILKDMRQVADEFPAKAEMDALRVELARIEERDRAAEAERRASSEAADRARRRGA
jgi:hypothetical protein